MADDGGGRGRRYDRGTPTPGFPLEALVLAENAGQLLEQTWDSLLADDGRLLRLLLNRFLYVGTSPDPRIDELVGQGERSARIEAAFRMPFWPYWAPIVRALCRHYAQAIGVAAVESLAVCRLWLEKTPWELREGVPFPLRREAAELAVAIARDVQRRDAAGHYLKKNLEARRLRHASWRSGPSG